LCFRYTSASESSTQQPLPSHPNGCKASWHRQRNLNPGTQPTNDEVRHTLLMRRSGTPANGASLLGSGDQPTAGDVTECSASGDAAGRP
jgi:hypothetical protein